MRPRLVVLALAGLVGLTSAWAMPGPVGAQELEDPPVEITEPAQPDGGSIPRPDSGQAPTSASDRGGAIQLLLLGLIVAFFALATFSVRRQMLAARSAARRE